MTMELNNDERKDIEQKFFRGHRVKIAEKLDSSMTHFTAGVEAIIDHSYSDIHDSSYDLEECNKTFYLLLLTPNPKFSGWYYEHQLTLIDEDRNAGEKLLQDYKYKK